jgi:hypothetical protein
MIESLRLFLEFLHCADSHLVDRPRGSRGPSMRSSQTVHEREVIADCPRGYRGPSARCLTARMFFVFV